MTTNQLQYQRNLEEQRANRAREAYENIKASASSQQAQSSLLNAETAAKRSEWERKQGIASLIIKGVDTYGNAMKNVTQAGANLGSSVALLA